MNESRRSSLPATILSVLLSLTFLATGASKLAAMAPVVANFTRWGYPLWFMYLTGVIELGCAIGLWVPRVRALAAVAIIATMIGALFTHLTHGEALFALGPVVLALMAGAVAYLRRDELRAWAGINAPR